MRKNNFWFAVATLVGSTVGVGVFGMPLVFAKAGIIPGILFLIGLTVVVVIVNLLFGEVVLRTQDIHALSGYANKYLDRISKKVLYFAYILGIYGALLSYIIISGVFASNFLPINFNSGQVIWSSLFFIIAAIIVFRGIKTVSRFDFFMLLFLVVIVATLASLGIGRIDLSNYILLTREFWFLPFGVTLFALSGLSAVPLLRQAIGERGYKVKKAILFGTLIPAVIYLVFTLLVVGISGDITSPDAISGLSGFIGDGVVIIGSLFGFLAVTTSFVGLGLALFESFQYDFGFSKIQAWFLALLPPYLLFLSGMRNFIDVISLVGGVALSLEGVFVLILYMRARKKGDRIPEYSVKLPNLVIYFLILIFVMGFVYTIAN